MTLAQGDAFVVGDIFSFQQAERIRKNWRAAAAVSNPQAGSLWSKSTNEKLYHRHAAAYEEIMQLTKSKDVSPQFATVRLMDTGADHYLDMKCNENLSVHRLLNLVLGNAARTITLSGNPTLNDWFDQAVKIASSPTHVKITLSDGQIVFPATAVPDADPNTLDDYEEGTWTPDLQFGGAKVDITYAVQNGYYSKIGRLVTVTGYITLTNKGSSVGAARIYGLPFTIANLTGNYIPVTCHSDKITFADFFQAYGVLNTTYFLLEEVTNAGVSTTLADTDFANDSEFMFAMTYFI